MNNSKKISIIIAIYNSGKSLDRCLNSIINQDFKDFELIIIDNCSSDNTKDIIYKFSEFIDIYLRENDNGIYDAWNKGVSLSSGEWLCFLGADDTLTNNSLSSLVDMVENDKDVNFISGKIGLNVRGKIKIVGEEFSQKKIRYYQNFAHIASLTKRSLVLDGECFDPTYKISGDYDFFIRNRKLIKHSFINKVLSIGDLGVSQNSFKSFFENYRIWKKNKIHRGVISEYLLIKHIVFFFVKNKWLNDFN